MPSVSSVTGDTVTAGFRSCFCPDDLSATPFPLLHPAASTTATNNIYVNNRFIS